MAVSEGGTLHIVTSGIASEVGEKVEKMLGSSALSSVRTSVLWCGWEREKETQMSNCHKGQGGCLMAVVISTCSDMGFLLGTCILANFNLISIMPQYVSIKITLPGNGSCWQSP